MGWQLPEGARSPCQREQEVHASGYPDQEPEYHWRDPSPRYHQSHDSCDESESNCEPHWASRHADPVCLLVPLDDGWGASRELPPVPPGLACVILATVSKYECAEEKPTEPPEDTSVDVESLDTPAPSPSCVHESIHSVQCGIMPSRLSFPYPDDEIQSRRLVHAGWIHCLSDD